MPNDINELDVTDYGLKQIMGDSFQDATEQPTEDKHEPDAEWHPVKERTWTNGLKACVKSAIIFGGLTILIYSWQQAGLMASSIAVPSMCVCSCLMGLGIGKVLGGDRK